MHPKQPALPFPTDVTVIERSPDPVPKNKGMIHLGDCLEIMSTLAAKSVDLIFADLPYGVSRNKWDSIIPLEPMWEQFYRLRRDTGTPIVLTATQPFTTTLVGSNLKHFKYEIIWEKTVGSGQFNIRHQPLRVHESVLVFYESAPVYNEQLTKGPAYSINRKNRAAGGYGKQKKSSKNNEGYRHARSVLKISNPRIKGGHPTQKPNALLEHIIKTYSNEGATILDPCFGSGSTLIACVSTNRSFVGVEKNEEFYNAAKENPLLKKYIDT